MKEMLWWAAALVMLSMAVAAPSIDTLLFNVVDWPQNAIDMFRTGLWVASIGCMFVGVKEA